MKPCILVLALAALAGCGPTINVVQLGEGRWRATADNTSGASSAEAAALGAASAHCDLMGRRMEANVARSQTRTELYSDGKVLIPVSRGEGAVNFTCVPRLSEPVLAGPLEDAQAAYRKQDYATALRLVRQLADQGDAWAQLMLGSMYDLARAGHMLSTDG